MIERRRGRSPRTTLVLFDIDGTLLLSGGAGKQALNETFEEQFGVAGAFDGIPVAGRTDPLLLDDALARSGKTAAPELRARFHDRYCELLAERIHNPLPRKGLMPGVRTLLARLEGRADLRSALLTGNFARAAQIKLEYFGLWRHFACGAYGDDAPSRDELVPVAVARAREQGIDIRSPRQVVVVGDTPLDIRCARAGGAWSVAVATGSFDVAELRSHGADRVLPDLADTAGCVEVLATMETSCGRN
jgi:phosphoglycolate phosphatase-like HAD superfamily hydrolase